MKKLFAGIITLLCILTVCSCGQNTKAAQTQFELPILMYHNICIEENDTNSETVTERRFSDDLELLAANSYTTILPCEIATTDFTDGNKYVLITFDDGYRSNYELAFPVLKQHNMKAEISVITSLIDEAESRKDFADWDMLREMDKSGLIEIGSHTDDLHNPDNEGKAKKNINGVQKKFLESKSKFNDRVLTDIKLSYDKLTKQLGHEPHTFAYPYGATEKQADKLIEELFSVSFSTNPGTAGLNSNSDSYIMPRYRITQDTDLAQLLGLEYEAPAADPYEYCETADQNDSLCREYHFDHNTTVQIVRNQCPDNYALASINDGALISWFENGTWYSETVSEKEYSADWIFIDDINGHYALYLPRQYKPLENNGLEFIKSESLLVQKNGEELTLNFSSANSKEQFTDFCFVRSSEQLIDLNDLISLECLYFNDNECFGYNGYYASSNDDLIPHGNNVFVNCPSCKILDEMIDAADEHILLKYLSIAFAHTMIKRSCPSGFIPSYAYSDSLNKKFNINEFDNKYFDSKDNSVFVANLSKLYEKFGGSEFRYYLLRYDKFCKTISNENGILEDYWAWNINRSTESTPEYQSYIKTSYYSLYDALGRSY